ncbi:MAG: cysteine hydrolase [Desulfobacterales bacterium]|nr:MAG: cysteine hydrolase [Desulfobacterales bacterium]
MKTGLILVDIQNDYFPGGRMELAGINEASVKAKDLLSFFRENRWPTFHIQHISIGKGATFFLPDTSGIEIHESVKPLPEDFVIQKHYPNSFRETDLYDHLSAAGVKRVVICGAMSHMCIDATTRAAADLGFSCVVVHDGCATRDLEFTGKTIAAEDVHGSFMSALGAAYARVFNLKDFLAQAKTGGIGA